MHYLTLNQVLELHERVIAQSGGANGLRDVEAYLRFEAVVIKGVAPAQASRFLARWLV